jgi:hypothetical protein
MTLHLVRAGTPLAAAIAARDWIVYRDATGWRLEPHGAPPVPAGPIDHGQLAHLVLTAARTVVW